MAAFAKASHDFVVVVVAVEKPYGVWAASWAASAETVRMVRKGEEAEVG